MREDGEKKKSRRRSGRVFLRFLVLVLAVACVFLGVKLSRTQEALRMTGEPQGGSLRVAAAAPPPPPPPLPAPPHPDAPPPCPPRQCCCREPALRGWCARTGGLGGFALGGGARQMGGLSAYPASRPRAPPPPPPLPPPPPPPPLSQLKIASEELRIKLRAADGASTECEQRDKEHRSALGECEKREREHQAAADKLRVEMQGLSKTVAETAAQMKQQAAAKG